MKVLVVSYSATPWTVIHQALSFGSSVLWISQARILEWVAISFSRDFPNPLSNPGLMYCRQILYYLSHQGSPFYWLKNGNTEKLSNMPSVTEMVTSILGIHPCRVSIEQNIWTPLSFPLSAHRTYPINQQIFFFKRWMFLHCSVKTNS